MTEEKDKISTFLGAQTGVPESVDLKRKELEERRQNIGSKTIDAIETADTNIRSLIEHGMELIPDLIRLTREAENPRMYEAAAQFMNLMKDLNAELVSTSVKVATQVEKNLNKPSEEQPSTSSDGNGGMFMTTESLLGLVQSAVTAANKKSPVTVDN